MDKDEYNIHIGGVERKLLEHTVEAPFSAGQRERQKVLLNGTPHYRVSEALYFQI